MHIDFRAGHSIEEHRPPYGSPSNNLPALDPRRGQHVPACGYGCQGYAGFHASQPRASRAENQSGALQGPCRTGLATLRRHPLIHLRNDVPVELREGDVLEERDVDRPHLVVAGAQARHQGPLQFAPVPHHARQRKGCARAGYRLIHVRVG